MLTYDQIVQSAREMYDNKLPMREIRDKLHIDWNVLKNITRNFPPRRKSHTVKYSDKQVEEIISLKNTMTYEEVAIKLGMTKKSVSNLLANRKRKLIMTSPSKDYTMIYLASPYSHDDENVRIKRFELTAEVTAALMRVGFLVFSPITHSHPLTKYGLPINFVFWKRYDTQMLSCCSSVLILPIEGWKESFGISEEVKLANSLGMNIQVVDIGSALAGTPRFKPLAQYDPEYAKKTINPQ